jgi:hypothetical protein
MGSPTKVRANFAFDEGTLKVIDGLKDRYRAGSRVEVLRKAIALLNVASQGDEVVIKGKDGEKHVLLG